MAKILYPLNIYRFVILFTIYCKRVEGCEEGWDMFGEKCYLFSNLSYGWEDAKGYCETLKASLVKIEDEREDAYVRKKLSEASVSYAWIGARFFTEFSEHRWLDGSEMTYNGWAPDRPGTDDGCVDYLQKVGYKWNSHCDCVHSRGPFICEKGCQHRWNMFGNKCYLFSKTKRGWMNAKAHCESEDGTLVIVNDEEEHEYIRQKLPGLNAESAWIGARFDPIVGEHSWLDGTSMTVGGWGTGRPGSTKGCVEYLKNYDYQWNSRPNCVKRKSPFICEKNCEIGWEKFGNKCYLLSHVHRGWEDAKGYCESVGASLVKVDNDLEHQYIRQKITAADITYAWIGARYDPDQGEHRWLDGSEMVLNGWAPGQPGDDQGCVDYLKKFDYLWNSHCDCNRTKGPFICQRVRRLPKSIKGPLVTDNGKLYDRKSSTVPTTFRDHSTSFTSTDELDMDYVTFPSTEDATRLGAIGTQAASTKSFKTAAGASLPTVKLRVKSLLNATGGNLVNGSSPESQEDEETRFYVCNPDNSIDVYNLPVNSYYFARQIDADTICTVLSLNATAAKITGCSKELPIVFTFGSYTKMFLYRLLGGSSVTTVSILCKEIPDSGANFTISHTLNAQLTIDSENEKSPTYQVSSELNATETTVGDPIAWTIIFPDKYLLEVSTCTAEPGSINRPDLNIVLISKGGCNINSDLITNFTDNSDGTAVATITAFRFYNDETILLKCDITVCPNVTSDACDTTCSRQKRDIRDRTYSSTKEIYTANVQSRLRVAFPHSGVSKPGITFSPMATFHIVVLLFTGLFMDNNCFYSIVSCY